MPGVGAGTGQNAHLLARGRESVAAHCLPSLRKAWGRPAQHAAATSGSGGPWLLRLAHGPWTWAPVHQSPGGHGHTPGRKEEEGECGKRGCSELRMVPKALIFSVCLTGCLSSQRDQRAQALASGVTARTGKRACRQGGSGEWGAGGQPLSTHVVAGLARTLGVRGVVLTSQEETGTGTESPAPRQHGRGRIRTPICPLLRVS